MAMDEEALAAAASALLFDVGERETGDSPRNRPVANAIDAGQFDRAPKAVRIRALHLIAAPLRTGRLSGNLVLMAASSGKPSGILASGAGVEFLRRRGIIVARSQAGGDGLYDGPEASGHSMMARVPGTCRIGTGMVITIYSTGREGGAHGVRLSWPVCIRSRRPGDSITLGCGHKMVDTLLSQYRIRQSVRDTIPVVEDRGGIAAVLCSCAGGKDIFRDIDRSGDGCARDGGSNEFFAFDVKGAVLTDAT
jgi:tRNA(Ile)-lysidine synthetase-like protein